MVKIFYIICFLQVSFLFAQKEHEDFDYLNHKYKYLDSKFKIKIDSATFNKGVKKYKFIEERIVKYYDSLVVVLMIEFDDWKKERAASLRITYTWERVSFYNWKTVEEIKLLTKKYKITHPYILHKKIMYPGNDAYLIKMNEDLRKKMYVVSKKDTILKLNYRQLLNTAFNNNPKVLELKKKYMEKRRIDKFFDKHNRNPTAEELKKGLDCGKPNCCQKAFKS